LCQTVANRLKAAGFPPLCPTAAFSSRWTLSDELCASSLGEDRPRTRKGITHNPPPLSSAVAQDVKDEKYDSNGLRVVLIGDQAVGKSSLASVFAGTSDRDQEESPGQYTFERTLTVDGEESTLTVMDTWDRRHNEACLLAGTAYVIVYSVADRSSFEAAAELRITLRRARQNERLPIIIVGNKSDLVRAREVTTQEGLACAVVFDCKFIETSASLNHNVLELFEGVVRQLRLHRDTDMNALMLAPLTLTPRRKQSLTERARRLLERIVSRGNHRVSLRARSKSCHDLAVL
uniref:GTP-binding protein REM 2 n=1 Tax=Neogobius melanostomus TaxID=47308 RepID=A0A8C6UFW9_9GOBI